MAANKLQEPVECLDCGSHNVGVPANYDSLVDSVKAQPAQEPVSFPCCGYTDANAIRWNQFNGVVQCHMCGQVYTVAQPAQEQRPWVGLTDEDIEIAFDNTRECNDPREFAYAVEAKLKEKNT